MEIVGLKNFVQDDVNKLISKFVGFKHHVFKKLLPWELRFLKTEDMVKHITRRKFLRVHKRCNRDYEKLLEIKSMPNRRFKFTTLPKWVRKEIMLITADNINDLFPKNKKNSHFINEQMIELNIDEL